ncbi:MULTISPECIES: hypothetical protein [unclassified Arthrobacter]|uniref:hypothetical protein n=1 Tax=unclassified Arthrobacter TaxID=235627 RepID=UPI00149155CB|nr:MULTISPECIES: hypothetical protein [unclassified Arthrobacter]MBE0009384.1 hypothetical protein [Arthrobacter sp. AET 35A]NOJ60698.1 hypothetical protein [Arthrobacter sp. 260]NOJ63219.1 hypothetical protein [Arthrobacter sp. 147(2020)]
MKHRRHTLTRAQRALATAGAIALSAGLWLGWFAWDTGYQIDPATGSASGPYEPWQVIGCVASWVALGWIANKFLAPAIVILAMPAGFTGAFAVTAATSDDSGLWMIGATLVAFGTLAGTVLLVAAMNWRRPAIDSTSR